MTVQLESKSKLKIICAWCGKDMGEKDGQGVEGTSHSICIHCLTMVIAKGGAESIPNPG